MNEQMSKERTDTQKERRNQKVAIACVAGFAGMIGVSYASVPLYELFCQVTGYGGTTQRVEQYSDTILDRTIKVRFDANTANSLPWDFTPKTREIEIRLGETAQVDYEARNLFSTPTSGRSTFNVTPLAAGAYFNKVECFCFTDTTLEPGDSLDMPVVFFVDPDIINSEELANIGTITLSYTFFPVETEVSMTKERNGTTEQGTTGG